MSWHLSLWRNRAHEHPSAPDEKELNQMSEQIIEKT